MGGSTLGCPSRAAGEKHEGFSRGAQGNVPCLQLAVLGEETPVTPDQTNSDEI